MFSLWVCWPWVLGVSRLDLRGHTWPLLIPDLLFSLWGMLTLSTWSRYMRPTWSYLTSMCPVQVSHQHPVKTGIMYVYCIHNELIYFKLESKLYFLRIKVSENVFSNFDKIKGNFTKQRHYFLLLITFVNENIFCKKLCLYERFWLCIYKKKTNFLRKLPKNGKNGPATQHLLS